MRFLNAYRLLDRLCHTLYPSAENGIGSYISEMEHDSGDHAQISGWEDDFNALRHCRRMRNELVNCEDFDEEALNQSGDAEWLEHFCQRIAEHTDPLSLAHQAAKPRG